jgi:hypothetical protein
MSKEMNNRIEESLETAIASWGKQSYVEDEEDIQYFE